MTNMDLEAHEISKPYCEAILNIALKLDQDRQILNKNNMYVYLDQIKIM